MMLSTSGLCFLKNLKNDLGDYFKKAMIYNINHNNNHCLQEYFLVILTL